MAAAEEHAGDGVRCPRRAGTSGSCLTESLSTLGSCLPRETAGSRPAELHLTMGWRGHARQSPGVIDVFQSSGKFRIRFLTRSALLVGLFGFRSPSKQSSHICSFCPAKPTTPSPSVVCREASAALCCVRLGPLLSDPSPWTARRGQAAWAPPWESPVHGNEVETLGTSQTNNGT